MSTFRALLLVTTLLPLAACGPTDVASPGEGTIVVPAPTPPAPPPPPPAGGGTPAAACPAGGYIDRGVVGTRRACELPTRFTVDTTIQNAPGVAYSIAGPVNVGTDCGGDTAAPLAGCQGVTLTIQAGTLLFASAGNDYLVVNRGSRISAIGTPTSPIIFTARNNLLGTTTDASQGLWGGIIILGRAPISDCNTAVPGGSANCQQVIEGTTGALYGGASPNDNSGSFQYVQIRYSGFGIAPGNELQGLTLGGVGQLTAIDHVQIHNSSDDGIEIFGGRPNLRHIVITGADDDGLDTDLGYRGTIQFVIGVQRDSSNGDSMIEADSNGNEDALPRQYTRVSNATFVQRSTVQGLNTMLIRGGADYALLNSVVVGTTNCLDIDGTAGTTTRAADAALQDLGAPVFRSVVMSCTNPFANDGNLQAETATAFGTGTNNNNSAYTPSLASVFINGGNEAAVPATDPTAFNADSFAGAGQPNAAAPNRLTAVTWIGAVQNAGDTWYQNWTCSASYVAFGGTGGNCSVTPA
ncbi:MAG TPA: hypothetical protein VEC11_08740 [Allosphingosinicella sp.]|nr:hypothetical protein [Allosphingosinicella sp.]